MSNDKSNLNPVGKALPSPGRTSMGRGLQDFT